MQGHPSDLLELGYSVKWIEFKFFNSAGREVQPDIILTSDKLKNTLLFEWKQGGFADQNQILRYSQITSEDIVQRAFIDIKCVDSFDVVYLCLEENKENIVQPIQVRGYKFPVLVLGSDGLKITYNHFANDNLNSVFEGGLKVDLLRVPTNFVPLDRQSEHWEVAEKLMPLLLKHMLQNKSQLPLTTLCRDLIEFWDCLGPSAKHEMKNKIKNVMSLASEGKFRHLLGFVREQKKVSPEVVWEIRHNPISLPPSKRRAAFQTIRSMQREFLDSLKSGASQRSLDLEF